MSATALRAARVATAAFLLGSVAALVLDALKGTAAVAGPAYSVACFSVLLCFQTRHIRRRDRPRPDYAAIAAMEREVYGETSEHDEAPGAVSPEARKPAATRKCQHCRAREATFRSQITGRWLCDRCNPCWCDYCRGRVGVHGADATALYRAQVAALRRERPS